MKTTITFLRDRFYSREYYEKKLPKRTKLHSTSASSIKPPEEVVLYGKSREPEHPLVF